MSAWSLSVGAQQLSRSELAPRTASVADVESSAIPKFVIGVGDVLTVTFWRDQRLSGDVLVRPDGRISLPLLNDLPAAGHTPEDLATTLARAAEKYITESDVTVTVKEVHSRRVFVVGEVTTPGAITLLGDMNVLQAIAVAGGLHEYADRKNIVILRTEHGQEKRLKFNYDDVLKGKNLKQNILLQPGDTVAVR
ncbi:MAG TPA: polysaccharide biosynthesis/export family protein [Vicinamibacterales bacterium]|nr:polysaccharide biosynthesis/export family protein [Vicinamibacterales bacterium]